MQNIEAAILGSGEIGLDLLRKIKDRPRNIQLVLLAAEQECELLAEGAKEGFTTTADGIDAVLADNSVKVVFDCSNLEAQHANSPRLRQAGKIVVGMTATDTGTTVVPAVNLDKAGSADTFNLGTYAGQIAVPMIAAISEVCGVSYAEAVVTMSSVCAGAEARANIDELLLKTSLDLVEIGGAKEGKAILLLNPADPPVLLRGTIYCTIEDPSQGDQIQNAVKAMVERVREYAPGYGLELDPMLDGDKVTLMVEMKAMSAGLPEYAGSTDVIIASALAVAEQAACTQLSQAV